MGHTLAGIALAGVTKVYFTAVLFNYADFAVIGAATTLECRKKKINNTIQSAKGGGLADIVLSDGNSSANSTGNAIKRTDLHRSL